MEQYYLFSGHQHFCLSSWSLWGNTSQCVIVFKYSKPFHIYKKKLRETTATLMQLCYFFTSHATQWKTPSKDLSVSLIESNMMFYAARKLTRYSCLQTAQTIWIKLGIIMRCFFQLTRKAHTILSVMSQTACFVKMKTTHVHMQVSLDLNIPHA